MKEKCAERPVCAKLKEVLEECNERVEGKEKTSETCTQELFDFVHCVDDCVSALMFFFYVHLSYYLEGRDRLGKKKNG